MIRIFLASLLLAAGLPKLGAQEFSVPDMVEIPAGSFYMGSNGGGYDCDEAPLHKVTLAAFKMSACEITNAQFEQFRPQHKSLRGSEFGISVQDNEAAAYISWYDALEYCKWLSEKTGRRFRLPTEAEWEYACKAGTYTLYHSGDWLPKGSERNQQTARNLKTVSLETGLSEPNAWGLYDMHGNVEEWCMDYYGPYSEGDVTNPAGPAEGVFRVTRGGSHNTPASFLRSTNRSAAYPEDFHSQIGFRIVESDLAAGPFFRKATEAPADKDDTDRGFCDYYWDAPTKKPLFAEPIPYVVPPTDGSPFYRHNHQPAITWCDNGDLLAIWFSCDAESGREMVVLGSRLKGRTKAWEPASLFFKVPDRNMTGSSLIRIGNGEILHVNGVGNSGDWQNLAMIVRRSRDGGLTWDAGKQVTRHAKRHQVIAGGLKLKDGAIVQLCDAGPEGHDGSAVQISSDNGETWTDPSDGSSKSTIGGIHAGMVELEDGRWMALGRGNSVKGKDGKMYMPVSISSDRGRSWEISASEFPPIDGGQRLVLMRLFEGPILLISLTGHPQRSAEKGMDFGGKKGFGVFAALSFDEGKTWPVKKLLSDGKYRFLDGGAWTGFFEMDAAHSEPRGYFAATQTPDGLIHILSSRLHYRINLPWLLENTPYDD